MCPVEQEHTARHFCWQNNCSAVHGQLANSATNQHVLRGFYLNSSQPRRACFSFFPSLFLSFSLSFFLLLLLLFCFCLSGGWGGGRLCPCVCLTNIEIKGGKIIHIFGPVCIRVDWNQRIFHYRTDNQFPAGKSFTAKIIIIFFISKLLNLYR